MRKMFSAMLVLGIAGSLTAALSADVVVLKDGTELSGQIRRTTGGYDVVLDNGGNQFVPDADVRTLRMGPSSTDADVQLTNLRRSVEPVDDLALIVQRYQQFIERVGAGPVAEKATQELSQWEQYLQEGRVRFNGKWVTPQAQRALATENLEAVNDIRELIKSGKRADALVKVQERLQENAQDVSAHYLLGLLQYRGGDVAGARRSFEQATELAPDHAPTANNLAVVLVRQNQVPRAVLVLGNALRDAPDTKSLLDNAAELIELVPVDERETTVYATLRQRFDQQDAVLAARLGGQGWFRSGAKWIDADTHAAREAQRKEVMEKIDALEADYNVTSQRIAGVEANIARAQISLADMRANSLRRLDDGRIIQLPLPDVYYEIEREVQADERDRVTLSNRLGVLQQEALQVRAELPTPLYSGELELIGADGVPVTLPLPEAEPVPQ